VPQELDACPLGHTGPGYTVVRDGTVSTKAGRKPLFRCTSAEGKSHRFRGELGATDPGTDKRRTAPVATCPTHRDGVVRAKGVRKSSAGTWRRYLCKRPTGEKHQFQVMVDETATPQPKAAPPPTCPEHPDSHVKRAGTYGKRGRRQRYLCTPVDGKPHQFTPPLSREAVADGDSCARCDELLSPHHGPVTAARHTPWTLAGIAQALNDLSQGASYANVSLALRSQRDEARTHLHEAHGIEFTVTTTLVPTASTTTSYSRKERRNAWRVAADLVEQYSPPLFAEVDARYRAEAQAMRDRNDAALADNPDAPLREPLVYVLDDHPILVPTGEDDRKRPAWHVLTVAEVLWRSGDDPFALPQRDTRLRLARAYPRTNADAWKLALDELGVRPDFVVADAGTGLQAAVKAFYGEQVGVVPSLWHIQQNLRDALAKLQNTTYVDGDERVLVDPLRKHLGLLAREELIGRTEADIVKWWDDLLTIVASLPAPVSSIITRRELHQPRLIAALPILTANPHVPASNATVENRIRNALKPFLENRSHLFGNAERTNRLLNLIVCRDAGVFTNLDTLALRIRQMNEANGGWAPAPRQILDKQPPATTSRTRRYSSLKSRGVVSKLAKEKGIITAVEAAAAAPMPLLSKQRPETVAALPIREWARSVGLPGGVTGPIRASVRAAYAAKEAGATDAEAKAVYEKAEAAALAKKQAIKNVARTGGRDRKRSEELAPIRAWAAEQGIPLSARGRIPAEVREAYETAQQGKTPNRRPSKQPKRGTP